MAKERSTQARVNDLVKDTIAKAVMGPYGLWSLSQLEEAVDLSSHTPHLSQEAKKLTAQSLKKLQPYLLQQLLDTISSNDTNQQANIEASRQLSGAFRLFQALTHNQEPFFKPHQRKSIIPTIMLHIDTLDSELFVCLQDGLIDILKHNNPEIASATFNFVFSALSEQLQEHGETAPASIKLLRLATGVAECTRLDPH